MFLCFNVIEQQQNSAMFLRNELSFPYHVTTEVSFKQSHKETTFRCLHCARCSQFHLAEVEL